MKEIQEKAWYLRETELAVLLAAAGLQEFYGYKIEGMQAADQGSINRVLFDMVRKGILLSTESGFSVKREYREIVKCLIEAEKLLIFNDSAQEYPEQYIYIGSKAIFLQDFGQRGSILRLEVVEKEQIFWKLISGGLKMAGVLEDSIEPAREIERIPSSIEELWNQTREQLLKNPEVSGCLVRIDLSSRKRTGQLLLLDRGFQNLIALSAYKDHRLYQYSVKKLQELLNEFVKG